ncbi:hypothetical protein Q73_00150 [Bacillus coahuilensis m2-6]|uniref:Cyclic-di-AMP phosphodiesterase n=1 Tax=Bacillus coahuilensis p1.1.43 TaxID=1150625 RepID=A0A147KCQ3_9BACI|nr:hypothetical protein Q75_00150 [Bacillus coahuilensis p1.1.43]KUP10019.1 hypothetical protein Q73_00150 [Bacillus coahuilensis m2-6]
MSVSILLSVTLFFFSWWASVISLVLFSSLYYHLIKLNREHNEEVEAYISTLSYRVKRVGEEALLEMPIGIMLINEDYTVEWSNPFLASWFNEDTLVGRSLYDVAETLVPLIKNEVNEQYIRLKDREYKVILKLEERLLYFFDVTEQVKIKKKFEQDKTVIGVIFLDNYDELTQGLDDQKRSSMNSLVTSMLNKWAKDYGMYLKRISSDRFVAVLNEGILSTLEENKFGILDTIREETARLNIPLTLSLGIGTEAQSLPELGALAQSSLDLALGRGGDQVAIKLPTGKVKFYGGKTNPMEKRTRVRARVISHALKESIVESDKVLIMGHKHPDMDAIGAAIGIRKVAQLNQREAYVVVDFNDLDHGVSRLMEEVKQSKDLYSRFISPEGAMELVTDETLLVVVDTHKPSLVVDEKLLSRVERVIVIDHHRRGEDFIENPLLVYMEPYASSTAELVTELLEYQPKTEKINMLEATALLAGIIVDTKSFTLRTGSRTFDAASYLRSKGADTVLVQKFLKENIETYIARSKLIESVELHEHGIAIAVGDDESHHDPVIIAQAADTLLSMDEVEASFVIAKRTENMIGISARSLGDVNVQIIMENLGGGGHLTNAATQLYDQTIEDAKSQLINALVDFFEGRSST